MSRRNSSKKKLETESKEVDSVQLFRTYSSYCMKLGISTHDDVRRSLTNELNPDKGRVIAVIGKSCGPKTDTKDCHKQFENPSSTSLLLGVEGCKALVGSILGKTPAVSVTRKESHVHSQLFQVDDRVTRTMCTSLQELRIVGSYIQDDGARAVASILRVLNPSMKLCFLELTDNNITSLGASFLARSLSFGVNASLKTLILDHNNIGTDGVKFLSDGLRTNSTLRKLSIRYCSIDFGGGLAISDMLCASKLQLVALDLTGNHLSGRGLNALCCPGLQVNTTLTKLGLADNKIASSKHDLLAIASFSDALRSQKHLTEVDLRYNPIGEDGGRILLQGLNNNTSIKLFQVDTSIRDDIFFALLRTKAVKKVKAKKKKKRVK